MEPAPPHVALSIDYDNSAMSPPFRHLGTLSTRPSRIEDGGPCSLARNVREVSENDVRELLVNLVKAVKILESTVIQSRCR